jgi:hypothetical protein
VNAPLGSRQSKKNTNKAKREVRFKQLISVRGPFTINSSTPSLRINLHEHPIFGFL